MRNILTLLLLIYFFLAGTVISSVAEVSCHCFQDRVFDPARPEVSDFYFLTTVQNSLMASAFKIPKSQIVKTKMAGIDADLLWVSYYVADRTGLEVDELLKAWMNGSAWDRLLSGVEGATNTPDLPFIEALKTPDDLQALARGAFHSVMLSQVGVDVATLASLERTGADRKDQIMAIFLSLLLGDEPLSIYVSVANGKQSWGAVLASTGLDPQEIEPSWAKLLQLHRQGL